MFPFTLKLGHRTWTIEEGTLVTRNSADYFSVPSLTYIPNGLWHSTPASIAKAKGRKWVKTGVL